MRKDCPPPPLPNDSIASHSLPNLHRGGTIFRPNKTIVFPSILPRSAALSRIPRILHRMLPRSHHSAISRVAPRRYPLPTHLRSADFDMGILVIRLANPSAVLYLLFLHIPGSARRTSLQTFESSDADRLCASLVLSSTHWLFLFLGLHIPLPLYLRMRFHYRRPFLISEKDGVLNVYDIVSF